MITFLTCCPTRPTDGEGSNLTLSFHSLLLSRGCGVRWGALTTGNVIHRNQAGGREPGLRSVHSSGLTGETCLHVVPHSAVFEMTSDETIRAHMW